MVHYILLIVVTAFVFDFINGFHDSANSIATIVGTRVLSPFAAVVWAAFFNFVAAFTVGTAVAKAIGAGMIDLSIVTPNVIMGGLLGAIVWNLITWFYGIPSSSSHALIGGYAGSAVSKAGMAAVTWGTKWVQTLSFIVISPLVGFDADLYRLGYGAGFYDRTLAGFAAKPRTIGVGFEIGRLPSIQPQPWDVPMDLIITEAGVFGA